MWTASRCTAKSSSLRVLGLTISRQTLANWMIYGANSGCRRLRSDARASAEAGHSACGRDDASGAARAGQVGRDAVVSVAVSNRARGPADRPVRLPANTRRGASANFLAGFRGYLHVDGYSGYHKVQGVTLVGCWAHARRKFDEALKALPAVNERPKRLPTGTCVLQSALCH